MNNIQPSAPRVSMLLEGLLRYSNDIDNTLLIGEQVQMIQEAGELYNEVRQLVTPEYFTDVEYNWLKQIGNSWNDVVQQYKLSHGNSLAPESQDILDDLTERLNDALNDFMDNNNNEDNYPL